MEDISVVRLSGSDVVRHKLVGEIVKAFEKHNAAQKQESGQKKEKETFRSGRKFQKR